MNCQKLLEYKYSILKSRYIENYTKTPILQKLGPQGKKIKPVHMCSLKSKLTASREFIRMHHFEKDIFQINGIHSIYASQAQLIKSNKIYGSLREIKYSEDGSSTE